MQKVYVPMVPSRFDRATNLWVPKVDISNASRFGEIIVMLPPEANRLNTVPLAGAMREKMRDFDQTDYLIALGDPTMIGIACGMAVRRCNGLLRMLRWDKVAQDYLEIEVTT